jgi:hypothetical protein
LCARGRGIQYAAPLKFNPDHPGVLDRSLKCAIARKAAMTALELMTLKDTKETIS